MPKKRSKSRAKKSNNLVAFALILGLLGAGFGGFVLIKEYILAPKPLPKARVYCNILSYTVSSGTTQKIDFTSLSYDTHEAYDISTDTFTVPKTGFYQIYVQISIEAYDEDRHTITVFYNGVAYTRTTQAAATYSNSYAVILSTTINAVADSTLSIYFSQYNLGMSGRDVYEGESRTYCEFTKIP